MAEPKQLPSGRWFIQIEIRGVRKSSTHRTKAEARAWADKTAADIRAAASGKIPNKSFGDLLERYRDEVSVHKKGSRWEAIRIGMFLRDELAQVRLQDLDQRHVSAWRDRRLTQVSAGSVLREWNLLSAACRVAVNEWKWLARHPMQGVRRPPQPPHRDRLISEQEVERLLLALGYDRGETPTTASARVGAALLFALETAMRAGELCGLTWARIDLDSRVAWVADGKTQAARRGVPLSTEAVRILRQLPAGDGPAFGVSAGVVDTLFRRAKALSGITDLHFHDTRHTAITRLAGKLDVLALARMVGHRDLRMLQVYYNAAPEDLARRL